MSRATKKRRAQRRERQAREALKPVPRTPDAPVDWNRLRQRYGSMKGRAVTLSYVLCGPRVEARTPEEFQVNLAVALAELGKGEPPS